MSNQIKIFLTILVILILASCKKHTCFEIIDEKHLPQGIYECSVYASDTNWVEMEKYAVNLIESKRKNSVIVFYNSIQANFKFKENGAYGKGALSYVIAKYGFCPDSCKYILAKYYNRFKIKLEIKHCY